MRVGSLFSGVGGLDLGLARAGFRHVFFCESDPWRRDVLAARWPGVHIYDDVRAVGAVGEPAGRAAADRGGAPVDLGGWEAGTGLLGGGFPCQDLSVAGQRRGLAGDRSGLFHEFARIIDAVRPGWVLLENVPGLLSSNGGRDFGVVLGTLADIGYGAAWRVLDSRFFGVPQRRRRVFIVGALPGGRVGAERAEEVLAVGSRCAGHPAARGEAREDVAGTLGGGAGSRGWPQDTERMTFVSHTLNAKRGKRDDGESETFVAASSGQIVRRLTPTECERLQGFPDGWTRLNDRTPDSRRYSALGDAVTVNVAHWLGQRLMQAEASRLEDAHPQKDPVV